MVVKVFETHSKYYKRHCQRIDCIPLITFGIPLKNTEFLNQIYPLNVGFTPFLNKKKIGYQVNQGITESGGSTVYIWNRVADFFQSLS